MSCAYRSHRYRASVTAHPASVSWKHPTGHAHHRARSLPPVVYPHRQAAPETADDAPIPVSLVQYLWAQWRQAPPEDRELVARCVANLMRSPRWHWDVTVLPDQSLPDPQHPFVFERDGRPTIGMPIAMLRMIWERVVTDVNHYAPIMQRFVSITDPALWQEFWQEVCALRNRAGRLGKRALQHDLYGYLSPQRLPAILPEIRRLLQSNAPGDRYTALTVLTRWLESPDHETRTVATRMLHGWPHVVAALVRDLPSDLAIREVLDRLVPTILTATPSADRTAWVATLWELATDSTLNRWRHESSADALKRMMIHDPMVAALVRDRLCMVPPLHPSVPAPVWDILLAGLMRTGYVGDALHIIATAIGSHGSTIARFAPIVADGWGYGGDWRILQFITSNLSPDWLEVLTRGITTSVGEEVCAIIRSRIPHDQAVNLIAFHVYTREERGDWPLAPLPEHLIPWVCDAAHRCPHYLHPTTVRRLWLVNPDQAWNVTQTMLDSGHPFDQQCAIAAMDAGWSTGHDAEMATTLRARILECQDDRNDVEIGIATAISGIGIAPPSLITALLTELAMQGNENVQRRLISALHRGWGQGQDDLVWRVVEIIAERDPSDVVWVDSRDTLTQAWDHLPSHVVVSLVDRLVTHAMNGLVNEANHEKREWMMWMAEHAIAAFAPGWAHLPTAHMSECIAHHVAHLHAHTIASRIRNALVSAWASVIAAGTDRLSAADIHALLAPPLGPLPEKLSQGS